jgi:oxygen-dependent protoporphyrinogen oxidase
MGSELNMVYDEKKKDPHIVIIGGGITGLSAAYYSMQLFHEAGMTPRVTLLESTDRFGGKIQTLRRDGYVIERGPDSFLARKWPMTELATELGIEQELTPQSITGKNTFILKRGKLHRIPQGLVLGVPTEWKPFLTSNLISWRGKARAALDLVLPARRTNEDESLGGFLRRRLGSEVVDFVAEPLLSGIYAGDADALSLMATFPQFREVEQKFGSLILGLHRNTGASGNPTTSASTLPKHALGSTFLSFRRGLSSITEKLEEVLRARGVHLRTHALVHSIRSEHTDLAQVSVSLENGERLDASIVIVTTPPSTLHRLMPEVQETNIFADMAYASVANIVLAYKLDEMTTPLNGSGFVVPRTEGRLITACTWTSSKWGHTAPDNRVLIRCYVGRIDDVRWQQMNDRELSDAVRRDLEDIMGIRATPEFIDINRLHQSMPQYGIGHLHKVNNLRMALSKKNPAVFVTGAGYEGVGLPDCIQQAKKTVLQSLKFTMTESLTNRS